MGDAKKQPPQKKCLKTLLPQFLLSGHITVKRIVARVWWLHVGEPARLHCHQEPEGRLAGWLVLDQDISGIVAESLPSSDSDLELHHLILVFGAHPVSTVDTSNSTQGCICLYPKSACLVPFGSSPLLTGDLRTLHESMTCYQVLGRLSERSILLICKLTSEK